MDFNAQQQAVITEMVDGDGNLLVQSYAGTGKTTVTTTGARGMPGQVLLCAFGVQTRDDLKAKMEGTDTLVRTTHQLGFRVAAQRLGSKVMGDDPEAKGWKIAEEVCADPQNRKHTRWVYKAASFAKNAGLRGANIRPMLLPIIEDSGAPFDTDFQPKDMEELVWRCLKRAKEQKEYLDYDDMVWLPYVYNLVPKNKYAAVLVDELQDLNTPQAWLVEQLCAPKKYGGRLIGVGDEYQWLYGFRGAGGAMQRFRELGAKELSMPVSFRCARAIVQYARQYVPMFEAAPGAPEGEVVHVPVPAGRKGQPADRAFAAAKMVDPRVGDAILSRTNAPLLPTAVRLLHKGMPVAIAGRDLGDALKGLIERSRAQSPIDLRNWITRYKNKLEVVFKSETARATKRDQADALDAVAEISRDMFTLQQDIDRLFQKPKGQHVLLSTVHRAKGLEWDRVWLVEPSFVDPSGEEMGSANMCIRYVACTRAKTVLFLVGDMTSTEDDEKARAGGTRIATDLDELSGCERLDRQIDEQRERIADSRAGRRR